MTQCKLQKQYFQVLGSEFWKETHQDLEKSMYSLQSLCIKDALGRAMYPNSFGSEGKFPKDWRREHILQDSQKKSNI